MSNKRKRFQDTLSDDINDFTQDSITYGVDEAIDYAIEDKVMDAIEGAARKKLGNHPALIMLPEFIRAQRGYGPIVREGMSRQLRIDLGLEAKFPSIEEVEEALKDLDNSDLLDDIVDEWEAEMQDLVDEFEEEVDDLEETEEELPDTIEETREQQESNDDANEEDDEEEAKENKKCWTVSLKIGKIKITFNSCEEEEKDKGSDENHSDEYEEPKLPEDDPNGTGWWCPIRRVSSNWKWDETIGRREEDIQKNNSSRIVGYWNVSAYPFGRWPGFEGELYGKTTGRYRVNVFDPATMNPGQTWEIIQVEWNRNDDFYSVRPFPPFTGGEFSPSYDWDYNTSISDYSAVELEAIGEFIYFERPLISGLQMNPDCRFVNTGDAPFDNPLTDKEPPTVHEEKPGEDEQMNDECCKATLSLTRKMYHVVGGADENLYPLSLTRDGETIEVQNLREAIEVILSKQGTVDSETLLQEIANVTGVSKFPLYPREVSDGNDTETIENIAKEVQRKGEGETLELIKGVANVTGTAKEPLYPLSIRDDNGNLYASADNITNLNEKMANVTGLSDDLNYPSLLPRELTKKDSENERINSLAQWHAYLFDMFDELIGQFPIDFKIEGDDANPRNIAEALAEIYGFAVKNGVDVYEAEMTAARSLSEAGQAKLNTVRLIENMTAIASYLGADFKYKEIDVEMTFNPLAYEDRDRDGDPDNLEEFLQPSKQTIKVMTEGEDNLKRDLLLITQAAQIIKALHWHKMSTNPALARDNLNKLLSLGGDIAREFGDSSWNDFTKSVEENWRDKKGIDGDNDLSDNPRIKEL